MSKIYLEVNGIKYEGFTEISVNSSLENFCSSFSFATTLKEEVSFFGNKTGGFVNDIKLQNKVKIYIDDILILTGYIEALNLDYDASNHSIVYSGRDIGGDMVDSSIIQSTYKQRNFTLLTKMVLSQNGFSDVKVQNKAGLLLLESTEIIKTEKDEKIFEFLDRYAKKLQVIIKINRFGNLEIVREDNAIVKNMLINNRTQDNNILSAKLQLTTKDRYNVVNVYSQANNKTHTSTGISQKGMAKDSSIRSTRRISLSMNTASQSQTLNTLAQWNVNVRRAKGSRYTCKVVDFYSERIESILLFDLGYNQVWQPNTLVDIIDEVAQISGTFLIQGVEFTQSINGSFTTLDIVEKGSFTDTKPNLFTNLGSSFADGLIESADSLTNSLIDLII
jgi:prophage tail gpP-like protein